MKNKPRVDTYTEELYLIVRISIIVMQKKIEAERTFPNQFPEASITLILKQGKDKKRSQAKILHNNNAWKILQQYWQT